MTVSGSGFTVAAAMYFGSVAGTVVSVNSGTELTVTSPAGTGTVDVTVRGPQGVSAVNTNDKFDYVT